MERIKAQIDKLRRLGEVMIDELGQVVGKLNDLIKAVNGDGSQASIISVGGLAGMFAGGGGGGLRRGSVASTISEHASVASGSYKYVASVVNPIE